MNQLAFWILVGLGIYLFIKQKFLSNSSEEKEPQNSKVPFDPKNYEPRKTLMTPSERLFFEKLKVAVNGQYDIYPQMNLDKIFMTKYQSSRFKFNGAKWAIDRRSVDFLLVSKETQSPAIAIEYDDSSHTREDRIVRDVKVDSLFRENGMKFVRFTASSNYTIEEIRNHYQ